jgi:prepilin-type N-terminal cleavage/methylation domain-containing protein
MNHLQPFPYVRIRDRGGNAAYADGFTLIELLVVLGIMAILVAIVSPLVPSLFRANQLDSSVNTLSGILEEAREAATGGNTYIWVAFTNPVLGSPAKGIWVSTVQSLDGTETNVNTSAPTTPVWGAITVPSTSYPNLRLHSKLQNLPGVDIVSSTTLSATLTAKAPTTSITQLAPVAWTVTTLANAMAGSGVSFVYAIEFTPNGEAHVPIWSSNIQFGLQPTIGSTTNSVLFNVSRLTGKTTVYRM